MKPTFRKGQHVTFFQNWNSKGTIRVSDLTVYSCGKKQMILVDANGVKFEGHNFKPSVEQWSVGNEVHPRMTSEQAHAHALKLGADVIKHEIEHHERCIVHYGQPETAGYTKAMRKSLAELATCVASVVRE